MVDDADSSAALIRAALSGESGAAADMILLNAGAALYAADAAATITEGIELARAAMRSGAARNKLEQLVEATR